MVTVCRNITLLLVALATSASSAYISVVTGANGFVARHVVHSLLQRQSGSDAPSKIVCLVRPGKVSYEQSYWDAHVVHKQLTASVKVMPYDMLDGGDTLNEALEAAIENDGPPVPCTIYHVASTFGPTPDPVETAQENVKSAEDVVRTLDTFHRRNPRRIKPRLVLTSSMAAVRATDQEPLNGKYYTHRDWNTLSKLNPENWGSCYQWSKAESERRAWELVKECNESYCKDDGINGRKIEMIALCPAFIFGPPPPLPSEMKDATNNSSESSSYSLTLIKQWLQGKSPVQSRLCADVRDVADAHVSAGTLRELPADDADRRYILSTEERLSSKATAEALVRGVEKAQKGGMGGISIDTGSITCDMEFTGGAIKIGDREVEAAERLKRDLGIVCRPVEETMRDMAEALLYGETF